MLERLELPVLRHCGGDTALFAPVGEKMGGRRWRGRVLAWPSRSGNIAAIE